MSKLAINGFGRIGRLATRVWYLKHKNSCELVAINTSGSMDLVGWAHLLKYDTVYGMFPGEITIEEANVPDAPNESNKILGYIIIDNSTRIAVLAGKDPAQIPWRTYAVDTVLECTGVFLTQEKASLHLESGAKAVILSAPGKDDTIPTIVAGVTDSTQGKVVSNASCTTNCIAPVISVLQQTFGVQKAMLNTIHSYTDDQNLQDGSHRDLRRARAGAGNIVPTTTGAAQTAGKVVSGLTGLFDGLSIRVPTMTGSLADVTAILSKKVTKDEINQAFIDASNTAKWQGIVATTQEPLVSSDIIGRSESAIVDLSLTQVVGDDMVKIIVWYDNEWGFSNRLVEMAIKI